MSLITASAYRDQLPASQTDLDGVRLVATPSVDRYGSAGPNRGTASYDAFFLCNGLFQLFRRRKPDEAGQPEPHVVSRSSANDDVAFASDFEINGVPVAFEKGSVHSCGKHIHGTLARDFTFNNAIFQAHTGFAIYEKNRQLAIGVLKKDTEINGATYLARREIVFQENGLVDRGILARKAVIDRIAYAGENEIRFDDEGRVSAGVLADETTIEGITFAAHNPISFDKGKVVLGVLAKESIFSGLAFPAQSTVIKGFVTWMGEDGESVVLSLATPSANVLLRGILFKAGESVIFDEGGNIWAGNLADEIVIDDIACAVESVIKFYPNGRIKEGVLARDTGIAGVTWPAGSTAGFDETGRLAGVILGRETAIEGISHPVGTVVLVDEAGRMKPVK